MNKERYFRYVKLPITSKPNEPKDAAETILYLLSQFRSWYDMKDSQDFVGVLYDVQDNLSELVSPELKEWEEKESKKDFEEYQYLRDQIDEWKNKYREEKEKNQKLREKNVELRTKVPKEEKPAVKSKVTKLKFNTKRKNEPNKN
jgi:hypothetical protein